MIVIPDASQSAGYAIRSVTGVAFSSDGSITLGDVDGLLRFSASGDYQGRLGVAGSGPGQIAAIGGWAQCADGSVLLLDVRNARLTKLDSASTALDVPLSELAPLRRPLPMACRTNALFVALSAPQGIDAEYRRTVATVVSAALPPLRIDTLAVVPSALNFKGLVQPLGASVGYNGAHDQLLIGRTDDSVLVRIRTSLTQDTIVLHGLPPAIPVDDAMWAARRQYSQEKTPPPMWDTEIAPLWDAVSRPDHLPLWDQLVVGDSARIWVRQYVPVHSQDNATRSWLWFDPQGRAIGRLTLPATQDLVAQGHGRLWLLAENPDGSRELRGARIRVQ